MDTDIGVNENAFGGEPLGATKSAFAKGWEQFADHEWNQELVWQEVHCVTRTSTRNELLRSGGIQP